jgi:hypothetical protein
MKSGKIKVSLVIICLIGFSLVMRIGILERKNHSDYDPYSPATATAPQTTIELGAYLDNFYLFQPSNSTFNADGWFWLKWTEEVQRQLVEHKIQPIHLIEIANRVDEWDSVLVPVNPEPERQHDGRYYQRFKFSGHFYIDKMNFKAYPFHTLYLPMIFELSESIDVKDLKGLSLSLDNKDSGMGNFIDIEGYSTVGLHSKTIIHHYGSNMGSEFQNSAKSSSPQVQFDVSYTQSITASIEKLFFPLFTIMALVLAAPSLSASHWDVRIGFPPTATLTLIFLQQSYRAELPSLSYITFMDALYSLCYATNMILFGLFLWGSLKLHEAKLTEKEAVTEYINAIDKKFQIGLIVWIITMAAINLVVMLHAPTP